MKIRNSLFFWTKSALKGLKTKSLTDNSVFSNQYNYKKYSTFCKLYGFENT